MLRAMLCLSLGLGLGLAATGCKRSDRNTGEDGDSELNGLTDSKGRKPKIVTTEPLIAGPRLDEKETRKVALIFYFADTLEPYMQGAVGHELRALGEACASRNDKINWVAFVNTLYVADVKYYLKCVGGKLTKETYAIPDLDKKAGAIAAADFDPTLKSVGDSRVALFDKALALKHPKDLNENYKAQPFVHPEIMKTIMTYAMTEIFSAKDYTYFVTLKGHGSAKFALTGLTTDQLAKKVTHQVELMTKAKNDVTEDLKSAKSILNFSKELDTKLGKIWLGQLRPRSKLQFDRLAALNVENPGLNVENPGLNVEVGGLNVENPGLNVENPGLSVNDPGLNLEEAGLGADNHFGMALDTYMGALRTSLENAKELSGVTPKLAFLNVESCESRLRGEIGDTTSILSTAAIRRYASVINFAEGSLWYRSYDWNNILYEWLAKGGTPASLQSALYDVGRKVINFKYE